MPDSTVVVLTALDVEYNAVRAHLEGVRRQRHQAGTLFDVGRPRQGTGEIVLGLTGVGNRSAAVLAERAIALFHPRAVLFVGVAGGLRPDVRLGDVVVGTKIYGYHGGLEEDSGFYARPEAWEAPHSLDQLARQVRRTSSQTVHFGPIAAGEVVLNSRSSPLAMKLNSHYNDAIAIEMESAGTAQAGHFNEVPVLSIRGISDRADGDKYRTDDEGWQQVAARNAAEFAMDFAVALVDSYNDSGPRLWSEDGLDWVALEHPVNVMWRLESRGALSTFSQAALEMHLIDVGTNRRIEVRRLGALRDELVALGRSHQLFTIVEQLRPDVTGDRTTVEAADFQRPAGVAVLRNGQTSVWEPLPRDMLGVVLDPEDLVSRISRLLGLLTEIDVQRAHRVVPAIGIQPATSVSEGSVRSIPRSQASISGKDLVRVQPDDSLPYTQIVNRRADVADELTARLLAEFRAR